MPFHKLLPCVLLLLLLHASLPGEVAASQEQPAVSRTLDILLQAAEKGDAKAQLELGNMYDSGKGVTRNFGEALKWYRKAAEQGDGDAQFALGDMYAAGQGVDRDYVQAYMWLTLSAAGSMDKTRATRSCERIAREMISQQIAEAERLAREWKPVNAYSADIDRGEAINGPYLPGNGVKPPIILNPMPKPQYTEAARQAGISGVVLLQCVVRKDGSADTFKILKGLGYGLDQSAIDTISSSWHFKPGTKDGVPVDVYIQIEISFDLFRGGSPRAPYPPPVLIPRR
jgi:uncharacterized protein